MGRFDLALGNVSPYRKQTFSSMKEVVEAYDRYFVKDGERIYNTIMNVPFSELPDDCDFTGLTVTVMNVTSNCHIWISGFDKNQNALQIDIPTSVQRFLFEAYHQGMGECTKTIEKLAYENLCVKFNKPIGYSNTVTQATRAPENAIRRLEASGNVGIGVMPLNRPPQGEQNGST